MDQGFEYFHVLNEWMDNVLGHFPYFLLNENSQNTLINKLIKSIEFSINEAKKEIKNMNTVLSRKVIHMFVCLFIYLSD